MPERIAVVADPNLLGGGSERKGLGRDGCGLVINSPVGEPTTCGRAAEGNADSWMIGCTMASGERGRDGSMGQSEADDVFGDCRWLFKSQPDITFGKVDFTLSRQLT